MQTTRSSTQEFCYNLAPDTCADQILTPPLLTQSMIDLDQLLPEGDMYRFGVSDLQPTFTLENTFMPTLEVPGTFQASVVDTPSYSVLPSTLPNYSVQQTVSSSPYSNYDYASEQDYVHEEESSDGLKRKKGSKKQRTKPINSEKYSKRLEANKKSAQASRERKKALKAELEAKFEILAKENNEMAIQMTHLETENKILRGEFLQLQALIAEATSVPKTFDIDGLPLKDNKNASMAAMFYLMFVLYSFGQHFPNGPQPVLPVASTPAQQSVSVSL